MEYVNFISLSYENKNLIKKAFEAAEHSVSQNSHKVGCAILCSDGKIFTGATNIRSRVIGTTCAERMAIDQLYYHGNKEPILCALVGLLTRKQWTKSSIITQCGVCLEMFWEVIMSLKIKDINFICSSWNKKRILKIKFSELYPRIEGVNR